MHANSRSILAIKYTLELPQDAKSNCRFLTPQLEKVDTVLADLKWESSRSILEQIRRTISCAQGLTARSAYFSVRHARDGDVALKLYLVGDGPAFVSENIISLTSQLRHAFDEKLVRGIADALHAVAPTMMSVTFHRDQLAGVGVYVAKTYVHLGLLNALTLKLGLPLRSHLDLLRWYSNFAKRASGRLGLFGFGVDVIGSKHDRNPEIYTFANPGCTEALPEDYRCWLERRLPRNAVDDLSELCYGSQRVPSRGRIGGQLSLVWDSSPAPQGEDRDTQFICIWMVPLTAPSARNFFV